MKKIVGCAQCRKKPVFTVSENRRKLCKKHFIEYFEKKVLRTIRNHELVKPDDRIGVAMSGGKDSTTALYILNQLTKKMPKLRVEALLIDEGIHGYRDETIKDARSFCGRHKIKLHTFSYKKEIGKTLDSLVKKKLGGPCTMCGIFRRQLINKKAKELGFTKIATGHNLDDEAQTVLMNLFKVDWPRASKLGPITEKTEGESFVQRIKPLYFMTERETTAYSFLMGFPVSYNECPYSKEMFRGRIRDFLNEMEESYPGVKHSIVNGFLELVPLLKKNFSKRGEMKRCGVCGDPTARGVCNACAWSERIRSKS